MSLRYPADRPDDADSVSFQHFKYSGRGGGGAAGGVGGIVLYIPEGTPAISNTNQWADTGVQYQGPLGEFRRGLQTTVPYAGMGTLKDAPQIIRNMQDKLKEAGGLGAYGRQALIEAIGNRVGGGANQITSLAKGEIYNPNTELYYNGPKLRSFSFKFNFAPKSSADAQAAAAIIKEFKTWSAPQEKGNKYEIPHVWQVSYSNEFYNKFKPAALIDINVDYNPGLSSHMTFEDQSPIVTAMTLTFLESELITRKDHQSGRTGY
jgi:hypothetical protein